MFRECETHLFQPIALGTCKGLQSFSQAIWKRAWRRGIYHSRHDLVGYRLRVDLHKVLNVCYEPARIGADAIKEIDVDAFRWKALTHSRDGGNVVGMFKIVALLDMREKFIHGPVFQQLRPPVHFEMKANMAPKPVNRFAQRI